MTTNFYDNTPSISMMAWKIKNAIWIKPPVYHPAVWRLQRRCHNVISRHTSTRFPIYLVAHSLGVWIAPCAFSPRSTEQTVARVNDALSSRPHHGGAPPSCDRSRSWFWIVSEIQGVDGRVLHQRQGVEGAGNRVELLLAFKAPPNFIETHQSPSN